MHEALAAIIARPALAEWLAGGGWARGFDPFSLSRSKEYSNEISIKEVEFIHLMGSGEIVISALVKGSRRTPYETTLVFEESRGVWAVAGECTCPVADDCKHAAALLQLLQRKILTRISLPASASAPALARVDPALITWLNEIEKASRASAAIEADVKKPPSQDRFLAYCIEDPSDGHRARLQFSLRVATRLKNGTVRIQGSNATADPSNPAQYMKREDIGLTSLYRQRLRKYGGWGSMPLEGPEWDELLDGALATGRLYFGREPKQYNGTIDYRAVTVGEPETFEATWENQPNGDARPVLRGSNPEIALIPTLPPRYLNRENATVGPLQSDLPPAVLATWARGPMVPASQIPRLIERFASVPSVALPSPIAIETETRPVVPPLPFLRIRKHMFANPWQRVEMMIGEVSFVYADSPRLFPLTKSAAHEHSALVGGKRVVWKRSFKVERAAEAKLIKAGLLPLNKLISQNVLDPSTLHAVAPGATPDTERLAWLTILEGKAFRQLREEGWNIDIDADCGLTAHDVEDFIPAIHAETDHGIDWFRFDVTFELDGKNVSLIPIIASAISQGMPPADSPDLPEFIVVPCDNPEDGFIRFPAKRLMEIVDRVRHLFVGGGNGEGRLDRLAAAGIADHLAIDSSETTRALARLGKRLRDIGELPKVEVPASVKASLRPYQEEGFRWLQFLAAHGLHGILADDMGLGKTLQTLTHLATEHERKPGNPSLVISPTSVVPNWAAEAAKFTPGLKVLTLHGPERGFHFDSIAGADVVLTSYPLLQRDFEVLSKQDWHVLALDEAQHIKNPKAITAQNACKLRAAHRVCLSGTPMENHLGELWSLMRFLMPGFLSDEKTFNTLLRKPIERDRSPDAQLALNRRVSPLILRRTKDQVASELPAKTEIIHGIDLNKKQADLYESVRASMDKRVREAIAAKGLAKSHIIVLDALLKLRQICCHPQLLKSDAAKDANDSAKLDFLTGELLPTLLEEGRRILLFSQFTSMLALIEAHLKKEKIAFLKLTGVTKERAELVKTFQEGQTPVFLISLKAGGTGLNLTAADTVIHYDPWWNPAAENQATDRAHRIGQTKPVFVHKLVCRGTIEDRILELQKHKSALVEALLSEDTSKLKLDEKTLSHLLAPLA